ncbi:nicotinate phosphoribosyltransferase [Neolewinella lacunae]|uniref:Nicotinate phosphoribosyltransferase n=1 Tax=Neolewinella lacunae TaxID=1517758 RepID=A0A923TA00_9BACT|nr:nicotinate phosphoribosyltransferase [Neolewinella lacunae]MBC6995623.1 nicotinate phosphoribosyltransferase [Neolewinella lacunae]MDN3635659.1 nicotinate phosphoribosyltransferase [Neolewinella lacunae]
MLSSHLSQVYRPDFGLLTDLYQLTMAAGYYDRQLHRRKSIFHLFYRSAPFGGEFALAAGLPLAVELVRGLKFSADDVQYLGRLTGANGQPLFREPFLNYLQRMRFSGDIYGVPEGEIVLPHEPLLRVEANLIEAQLLETALLTVLNFSTLIATKAARIRAVAGDDTVLEFGLRRAQGIDGGLTASRSAYLGGCDASSNVWAGRYYNIPVRGTHAHSWVMAFPSEEEAFDAYATAMPNNTIFLVDTYDTLGGIREAIRAGERLRQRGHEMLGIRLDSGDLLQLSIQAREMLDAAGFPNAKIVASDNLDEHTIQHLKASGARIDTWGVGTRLVTGHESPALGGVYKMAAIENADGEWETRVKRSSTPAKASNPGRLGIRRYADPASGQPLASLLYDDLGDPPSGPLITAAGTAFDLPSGARTEELLQPVFRSGDLVMDFPTLAESRSKAIENWARWAPLVGPHAIPYGLDARLHAQKLALLADHKA